MGQNGSVGRETLPIPDRPHIGLITYDAKDPATSFPPIESLRPPAGAPNVLVVLLDDAYVEGSSETVARTDLEGNTYQIKTAPDGERYEVPKTYPSDSALRKKLASSVREIKIARNEFYWILTCRLK